MKKCIKCKKQKEKNQIWGSTVANGKEISICIMCVAEATIFNKNTHVDAVIKV